MTSHSEFFLEQNVEKTLEEIVEEIDEEIDEEILEENLELEMMSRRSVLVASLINFETVTKSKSHDGWFNTFVTNYRGDDDEAEENNLLLSELVTKERRDNYYLDWNRIEVSILRNPKQVKSWSVTVPDSDTVTEITLSLLEFVLTTTNPPLYIVKEILRANPDSILGGLPKDHDDWEGTIGMARPFRIAYNYGVKDNILKYLLHATHSALQHNNNNDSLYKHPLDILNFLLVDEPRTVGIRSTKYNSRDMKSLRMILVEMSHIIAENSTKKRLERETKIEIIKATIFNMETGLFMLLDCDLLDLHVKKAILTKAFEEAQAKYHLHQPSRSVIGFFFLYTTKKYFNLDMEKKGAYMDHHVNLFSSLIKIDQNSSDSFWLDEFFIHKIVSGWWPPCWKECGIIETLINVQQSELRTTSTTMKTQLKKSYNGSLPLHLAIKNKWPWGIIQKLFELEPQALQLRDTTTGLYPFQLAILDTATVFEVPEENYKPQLLEQRQQFSLIPNTFQEHIGKELLEEQTLRGITNCFHLLRRSPQHVVVPRSTSTTSTSSSS